MPKIILTTQNRGLDRELDDLRREIDSLKAKLTAFSLLPTTNTVAPTSPVQAFPPSSGGFMQVGDGTNVYDRSTLVVTGSGFTLTDDNANDRIVLNLTGTTGGDEVFVSLVDMKIITGNAFALQTETDNFNGYQSPPNNGDTVSADFMISAGTYHLYAMRWNASNMGIVDMNIDGVLVGSHDCYTAAAGNWQFVDYGPVTLTAGHHRINSQVNGKNASSSGYYHLESTWMVK